MTRVHSTGPTRVHGQGRDKSSWHSHRAGRQGVKQRPPSPTAEGAPRRRPPRRRPLRRSPPRPSPLRRRAPRRSPPRPSPPTAKSTAAKPTAARSTASRASASGTTASRASASPKAPASGSTARSSSRSTTRGTARTAPARTATARTAPARTATAAHRDARTATARTATSRATTARTTTARATTARRTAARTEPSARCPPGCPRERAGPWSCPAAQATGLEASRQRMTPAERRVRGKAARAEVPRESHAEWKPPADRPDPVALLESQGAARVPDLVPVRYGRMMETPFTYYRGAALPMASDLATTPATGIIVQACGDAHLSNFGLFGSPERKLVFDVNDFDETLPAPWEWDVKRLAASLEVAARENGFSDKDRRKIVLASTRALPAGHAAAVRAGQPGRLVHPGGHRRLPGPVRQPAEGAPAQAPRQGPGQGPDPGQHAGAGQADPDRGRAAADHFRATGHRPAPRPAR